MMAFGKSRVQHLPGVTEYDTGPFEQCKGHFVLSYVEIRVGDSIVELYLT